MSLVAITLFSSCSGCTKKVSKKLTETGLDAIEGISEAVDEHGAKVGEKATDAAGKLAEGIGTSLDRQMDEHAEKVASVLGRTLVQTLDGVDKGIRTKYYDVIACDTDLCPGVTFDYLGKMKSKTVIDAYFIVHKQGTYECNFKFIGNDGKVYLTKEAEIVKPENTSKYSVVSFALTPDEVAALTNNAKVEITVSKK